MSTNTTAEHPMYQYSYDRPMGVSFLSIYLIGSGITWLIIQWALSDYLFEGYPLIAVSENIMKGAHICLGLLGIVAGIGILLGKKWGWWLAVFYLAYDICRSLNVIAVLPSYTSQYIVDISRILWSTCFIAYMTGERVTTFHNTTSINKTNAVLTVFGICIILFATGMLL